MEERGVAQDIESIVELLVLGGSMEYKKQAKELEERAQCARDMYPPVCKFGGGEALHTYCFQFAQEPFAEAAKSIRELLLYKEAVDRMGRFGGLFVEYKGDPRGPVGRSGNMRIEDEAQLMPVITDVDGGKWRPVQEEVLQDLLKQLDYWKEQSFKACYEKQELSEKAERAEKALDSSLVEKAQEGKLTSEELRGMVGGWVRIVHLDNDEKTRGFAYVGSDGIYTYLGHSDGKYTIQAVFEFEECGKAFWAYPCHPAHIDQGKWDSCIKCNGKCYFCKFNETSKCRKCKNHGFYSPMFNFCPDCGRPLTPEAWAELEKRVRG